MFSLGSRVEKPTQEVTKSGLRRRLFSEAAGRGWLLCRGRPGSLCMAMRCPYCLLGPKRSLSLWFVCPSLGDKENVFVCMCCGVSACLCMRCILWVRDVSVCVCEERLSVTACVGVCVGVVVCMESMRGIKGCVCGEGI